MKEASEGKKRQLEDEAPAEGQMHNRRRHEENEGKKERERERHCTE